MDIEEEVRTILLSLNEDVSADVLTENLFETGVLDSLGMARLVPALEEKFAIEIGLDDIDPDNFVTLAAITAFVAGRKKA